VVTHQLQVERRTAKAHRPKTNALPLDYATNHQSWFTGDMAFPVVHEDGLKYRWWTNHFGDTGNKFGSVTLQYFGPFSAYL